MSSRPRRKRATSEDVQPLGRILTRRSAARGPPRRRSRAPACPSRTRAATRSGRKSRPIFASLALQHQIVAGRMPQRLPQQGVEVLLRPHSRLMQATEKRTSMKSETLQVDHPRPRRRHLSPPVGPEPAGPRSCPRPYAHRGSPPVGRAARTRDRRAPNAGMPCIRLPPGRHARRRPPSTATTLRLRSPPRQHITAGRDPSRDEQTQGAQVARQVRRHQVHRYEPCLLGRPASLYARPTTARCRSSRSGSDSAPGA